MAILVKVPILGLSAFGRSNLVLAITSDVGVPVLVILLSVAIVEVGAPNRPAPATGIHSRHDRCLTKRSTVRIFARLRALTKPNTKHIPTNMKKFLILLACAGFLGTASAQTGTSSAAPKEEMKDHTCSATCTKKAHAYAHGEKGHTCTEACQAPATTVKKAGGCCAGKKEGASCAKEGAKTEAHVEATKDHACTAACQDGKHTYACGEKGHQCGDACAHKD